MMSYRAIRKSCFLYISATAQNAYVLKSKITNSKSSVVMSHHGFESHPLCH
nr:MAG TPA: hypothetical protein [Caudoviricetes sp.]